MRTLPIIAAALLTGCVTDAPVQTADGRLGHVILCPGGAQWAGCLKRAGDLCGARGYDVLDRSEESNFVSSYNAYGGYAGTVRQRSMVIACKGPT
jgi:hypothetical protein